ncbi:endolytic transglycosylase MltG [Aggregatimonas sangjinii]|uniref:Endolytic murein transglycosylase n=1 Tax=Aggregatimonas sangjinii TaxID=2583587 RepID=A0A5B7SP47_9FLAO|nr:endolytic transglycosylase MltG [Aggregatimonas sangjinii]QCX00287.1 endolytic transglycosylase MltG [Aggregatimonas sangjinii]
MYIKKILLAIVGIGLVLGGIFAYMVYGAFLSPNTSFTEDQIIVHVRSEAGFEEVKDSLSGYLQDIETFGQAAQKKGYASNIKGGRYAIKKGMNNNEIINSLRSKNLPVKVSFNNQERLENLAGRIATQIEADSVSLLAAMRDPEFLSENNLEATNELAVYLPNSYEFFWNTSAEEFRDRMLKEYQRFWTEERIEKAKKQGLTPNEAIALAAIVHKETAKIDERPRVAGLYLNRLKTNMLLQADPTVIYAIKKHRGDFDIVIKRVLYKDLEIDSPYNTYKYAGVPPGPITMPDISAIEAVLNPEQHDYIYMVANVENFGYHKFAKTAAQHNRNKVQYVRWINAQGINR